MTDTTLKGVTNIAFQPDGSLVITSADQPPPNGTRRVNSLADMRAVFKSDEPDVTIAPGTYQATSPIALARIASRVIRAEPGAVIQGNGQDFHILALNGGDGGQLEIYGLTIDGGWLRNKGECPSDAAASYFLPSLDSLLLQDCTTRYSRRTGIFVTDTKKLVLRRVSGFAMPRDFLWSNGSQNVLVEDCDIQHCGDDGIGSHVREGESGANRVVVFRRNTLKDTLGIKVLGEGKQILIEDNNLYGCGFYGIRLGMDPTTGEGRGTQRNITVRRNRIENIRKTSPNHPGQKQGVWLFMHAKDDGANPPILYSVENVTIGENTLIRNMSDGDKLRDSYAWASLGSYSKSGFIDEGITIGTEASRYTCINPSNIIGTNSKIGL